MKQMKLYTAKVTFDFVVVAKNSNEALQVALFNMRDALGDLDQYQVDAEIEPGIHTYKWDDDCVPYGGDGNTRTSEYKIKEETK